MPEYAFPSGIEIREVNIAAWSVGLHLSLVLLLIGAAVLFVWRCRHSVSLWDIPAWIAFVAVSWGLSRQGNTYPLEFRGLYYYVALILLIALIAIGVTLCRYVNRRDFTWNLAILGLLAPCFALCLLSSSHPREATWRTQCKNNLKYIGLAVHNYHDAYAHFPFAGIEKTQADSIRSWRVALVGWFDASPLPFEYRFDEPWNSEHNVAIQKLMPALYRCPSHPTQQPFTAYAMLTGPGTFGGDGSIGLTTKDITDATSNTLMIVEACGRDIIWTEPRDVEVNDASLGINLPGDQPGRSRGVISSYHFKGAHVLFVDGSVRYLPENMDTAVLKALTTVNGGEAVPAEY